MLIIHRRPGESILIGDNVEIQVVEISQGRVRLGIRAPAEVVVLRKEIQLAREQNIAAASGVFARRLDRFVSGYRGQQTSAAAAERAGRERPPESRDTPEDGVGGG